MPACVENMISLVPRYLGLLASFLNYFKRCQLPLQPPSKAPIYIYDIRLAQKIMEDIYLATQPATLARAFSTSPHFKLEGPAP